MSARWTELPPGVRVASEWGGKLSPAERIAHMRKANRAERLARGTTDRADFFVDQLDVVTTNVLMRMHHMKQHQVISAWRDLGAAMAKDRPAVTVRVGIEVYPVAGKRGGLGDAASRALVVKGWLDGACDAGLLEDDSPEFVAYERHWAPARGDLSGLRILLVPADSA